MTFAVATCRPDASYCTPTVTVWDLRTRRRLCYFPLTGIAGVWPPIFSGDGTRLYAFRGDTTVHVFDLQNGREINQLRLDPAADATEMLCVAGSADGKLVFGGLRAGRINAWDVAAGQLVRQFNGHTDKVRQLAVSGNRLASACLDGTVRVWDADTGQCLQTLQQGCPVEAVTFIGGLGLLAAGGEDGKVVLWDATTGERRTTYTGHEGAVTSLDVSPDGRLLLSGSADGTARSWIVSDADATLAKN